MKSQNSIRHIVLVDDDQDDCEIFGDALHEFDPALKLSCLTENERLLSFLDEKKPDLVFLDVNMPRRNGFDCLEEIRSQQRFAGIPVIMYSNTGRQSDIDLAYRQGANLFLRKPSSFRSLVESLQQIVAKEWSSPQTVTAQYFSNGRYHPLS